MRDFAQLSPLFRASIGFDRLFDALQSAMDSPSEAWPHYDILKTGEDAYSIRIAVPGFARDDLEITHAGSRLTVTGSKAGGEAGEYLHRGLPAQSFTRRFELADYVKVTEAELADGILTIRLVRDLPEAMKPRRLQIRTGSDAGPARIGTQSGQKQAA